MYCTGLSIAQSCGKCLINFANEQTKVGMLIPFIYPFGHSLLPFPFGCSLLAVPFWPFPFGCSLLAVPIWPFPLGGPLRLPSTFGYPALLINWLSGFCMTPKLTRKQDFITIESCEVRSPSINPLHKLKLL